MRKNALFFSLIFHRFFAKNRRKMVQKARKPALCTKIDKNLRLECPFLANNRFFLAFWDPSGSPGGPRDVAGVSQNLPFLSKKICCVSKRTRTVPGRPQGGPGCPPGTSRASFWIDFGSIFRINFHTRRMPSEVARKSKTMRRGHKSLAELSQRLPGYCLWLQ